MSKPDGCTAELVPGMIKGADYFLVRGNHLRDGAVAVVAKPPGQITPQQAIEQAEKHYGRAS